MSKPVAVITGASSGIGLVFARRLARDHDLVLVARRRERLEQAAAELAALGAKVEVLQADLSVDAELALVAERIAGEPNLAMLVNNAGFGAGGYLWETSLAVQEEMHRLHVMATLRLSHAALTNMVAREAASGPLGVDGLGAGIINVASVAAFLARAGSVSYGSTKAWMAMFTEGLAMDLRAAGSRLRVQALCPGFTYSEFHAVMGVDGSKVAGKAFWMTAEQVVDASLAGFAQGKVFVVPGWRYQAIVALIPRLPAGMRMALLSATTKRLGRNGT
ncbi:MAG TPA: SDR family NAD(P)-dependent oxidoreductase [Granulicella sp.]|jgi:short-subunit dehydrogenase|nr:SDR family NAD(P)-dependent oxidoreductase [Granulicella sp.]